MTGPKGDLSTFNMIATAVTFRHIGPAVSWLWAIGIMPSCEIKPTVGFSPTQRLFPDGQTTEPSVSVPTVTEHKFVAAATAEPELEPHGSKSRRYGSRVKPPRALQPLNGANPRKLAHSERFALPRITAPAARRPSPTVESAGTLLPTRDTARWGVCRSSAAAMLS